MFKGSCAHNESKLWGSLEGSRSCRQSGTWATKKGASPDAECISEGSLPGASGKARVLASDPCWQEVAVPSCVSAEAVVMGPPFLLLMDVVTGQWEAGVGSTSRPCRVRSWESGRSVTLPGKIGKSFTFTLEVAELWHLLFL